MAAGLRKRDSGLDASENFVGMIAAAIRREISGQETLRRPQVGRSWVVKAPWHYADLLAASAVDGEIFADDLGVGAKDALPQPVAEDDNAIVALLRFVGRKGAAEIRFHAKDREKAW